MKEVLRGLKNILRDSRVKALLSLFFLFIGTTVLAFMNLGYTVALILTLVLKPTFQIEEIKFLEWGKISGKNVELIYGGEKIVVAPEVSIEYDIRGPLRDWLRKISIENPEVFIERNGSEVNIVEAFATGGDNKSGTGVPIGIIEARNGNLTYRDISYEIPIEKKMKNVHGYVSFDKMDGIDLLFSGEDGEEKASYSFNNLIEDYDMNINLKNMEINTVLLQYGYYYEPVQYKKGKVDLDLTISPRGLEGYADLKEAVIEYGDFSQVAENIQGRVDFLGEKINIEAEFELFGEKREFNLNFDFDKGMDAQIELGKLTMSQLKNYKLFKDIPIEEMPLHIENLRVILNLDEERNFSLKVIYKFSDSEWGPFQLKNSKGSLLYAEEKVKFDFLKTEISMEGMEKEIHILGVLQDENMKIEYNLDDFKGKIELSILEEQLKFTSREGIIELEGFLDYESGTLTINGDEKNPDSSLIYDIKEKNLKTFQGKWSVNIADKALLNFEGTGEENEIYFDNIEILQNGEITVIAEGELDLKTLYYRFNYESENFLYSYPIQDEVLDLKLYSIGQLLGTERDFRFDSQGTIEMLKYQNYNINGLKYSLRMDQNEIQILNVSNNILTLNGNYNIIENRLALNYEIKDLDNEYLRVENVHFKIESGEGTLQNDNEGLFSKLNIKAGKIYPMGEEALDVSGEVSYENGHIKWNDIKLNQNSRISGEYNLGTNIYNLEADIFETNLSKYLGDKNFKYRVIGRVNASGNGNKIDADGSFTVDDVYFKGERIGKFRGELSYSGDEIAEGILKIKKLDFIRYRDKNLSIMGEVDLKNETINLVLDEEEISLEELYKEMPFNGKISLKSQIGGSFKNPEFSVGLVAKKITVENLNFDNIVVDIKGNLDKLQIEELSFNYLKNRMDISGFYGMKSSEYFLALESKEINLEFLNLLIRDDLIKNIEGEAFVDVRLSNSGNEGIFKGSNISFSLDNSRILGEKVNFIIGLSGKKIEIEKFSGEINGGFGEVKGYFNIPSLTEINKNSDFIKKLDYNISLNLKEVEYKVEEELEFKINSILSLSENKISGKIDFLDGKVSGIPGIGDGISILGIIKKIITTAIPVRFGGRESIDKEYETGITSTQEIGIDLDFRIINGIEIEIPKIWNILEDIGGRVKGSGKLSGQLNKLNFLGQVELEKGEFILGENDFKVLTGRLVFNNPEDYIPNINPILTFEAKSPVESTEISLTGEITSLNFRIQNSKESSSGTLASLFNSEERYSEENNRVGPSATIIKNLLGAQLTNSFLSPTARTLKKIFGLSKLRITADITDNFSDLETQDDKNNQTNFNFGIKVVAEDAIYKDKLFAVADARITGANDEEDKRNRYGGYNNFDRYSVGMEYRYAEGQSLGIGVQNEGENGYGSENQKIKKEKLNYYIDFKIEKKYDSLMEIYTGIIKNIFPKR